MHNGNMYLYTDDIISFSYNRLSVCYIFMQTDTAIYGLVQNRFDSDSCALTANWKHSDEHR